MKLTKKKSTSKEIYFCGCEIPPKSTAESVEDRWDNSLYHKKNWDRKKFRYEYVCRKAEVVAFKQYKIFDKK